MFSFRREANMSISTPASLEPDRDWTPAPGNKTDLYDDSLFEPFPKGMQAKSTKTSR